MMSLIDIQNLTIKNTSEKSLIKGIDLKIFSQQINALIGESGAGKSLIAKALLEYLPFDLSCTYDSYQFDGENVGILGESGCGKSTLASLVLGLFKPAKGEIYLSDNAVLPIFQHPLTSFNPDWTIETSLKEALYYYRGLTDNTAQDQLLLQHLSTFELNAQLLTKLPSEVSGGQLQRFNVMRSLLAQPRVLICDEITSNLDVIAEQNVINILKAQTITNLNHFIVISHDLSVLQRLVNRIIVLKDGMIVDDFAIEELFNVDRHPYTKELVQAFSY